jgi:hypothetical protein
VQCFVIEGSTKKLLGTTTLQLLEMADDTLLLYSADCFHYAVKKGILSLRATSHSFVFPGAGHQVFGIILPASAKKGDLEMFIALLSEHSDYSVQIDDETTVEDATAAVAVAGEDTEDKVAKYGLKAAALMKKGTALASAGIAKGTVVAASGIRKAKEYAKKKTTKTEDVEVSETTRERIKKVKAGARGAVKISNAIVVGARSMCSEMSSSLADAASKTEFGKKMKEDESERTVAAKAVGKAAIVGIVTIMEELEEAALVLVAEVADSSAEVARHKYGDQVGEAADDTADIVKSGSKVVKAASDLTVKAVVKHTAADAAVQTLSTDEERAELRAKADGDEVHDPEAKALKFMASAAIASTMASEK